MNVVNGLSPQFFKTCSTSLDGKHNKGTRQSTRGNLFLEMQNIIQYGIRSIQYSGEKFWNSIPSEIRLFSTVKRFWTELKNLLKLTDLSFNLSFVFSILALYFDVMGKQIDPLKNIGLRVL